jgi:hypothetical protein
MAKDQDEPPTARGRVGIDNGGKFLRAEAYLRALPQAAIIDWLLHSEIGETCLAQLEKKLNRPGRE